MDPYSQSYMDSCTQPCTFTTLLNSQLEPPSPEMFCPSMAPGSSQQPQVIPEISQAPDRVEEVVEVRRERRKWTLTEDIVLCSTWLNTSKDVVVGNKQKLHAFWKRIAAYFNASPKLAGSQEREASNCKQRWHKINDHVCKFVGCFEAAKRQQSSGQNDDDVLKVAYDIFFQDQKLKFSLEHAWIELRNDQKWCASLACHGEGNPSKRKFEDQTASSDTVTELKTRPEGVKAAKNKGKGSATKGGGSKGSNSDATSLVEFQEMWNIKEKDLAMKERLSKVSLLDNMITKKGPLDELEMALKNKLIADMLDNV